MTDTKQKVFDCLDDFAEKGQPLPSIRQIRNLIAIGSLKTIADAKRCWQIERSKDDTAPNLSLNKNDKEAVLRLIEEIFASHMQAHSAKLERDKQTQLAIERQTLEALKQEADVVITEHDSLVDKLHALEQALAQAQRQNAELQAQAQEREGITAELRERLDQALKRLDQEVQARARLEGILDTLRQQTAKRSAKSTPTQA